MTIEAINVALAILGTGLLLKAGLILIALVRAVKR